MHSLNTKQVKETNRGMLTAHSEGLQKHFFKERRKYHLAGCAGPGPLARHWGHRGR